MALTRVSAATYVLSIFALCVVVAFVTHLHTTCTTPSINVWKNQFSPQKEYATVIQTQATILSNNSNIQPTNPLPLSPALSTAPSSSSSSSSTSSSLSSLFTSFSWEDFFAGNESARVDLLSRLQHFMFTTTPTLKHTIVPNITYDCTNPKYAHLLTGKVAPTPMRILDFFGLLSELDVLTIRLHELDGLVDQHIIYESTRSHRGKLKPLYYHSVASRYAPFHERIVHMVEDDTFHLAGKLEDCPLTKADCWAINSLIWTSAVAKYRVMYPEMDTANTLIISGDIDEIPSREAITHMKYCEITSQRFPIGGSSIMYMYSFDWLFRSDWPSQLHGASSQAAVDPAYTLRFPTINLASTVMNAMTLDRRGGYAPRSWLPLGEGAHITDFGGLPFLLQKYISSNEAGFDKLSTMRPLLLARKYDDLEDIIYAGTLFPTRQSRIMAAQSQHFVPWIVKQNRPAWKSMIRRRKDELRKGH